MNLNEAFKHFFCNTCALTGRLYNIASYGYVAGAVVSQLTLNAHCNYFNRRRKPEVAFRAHGAIWETIYLLLNTFLTCILF